MKLENLRAWHEKNHERLNLVFFAFGFVFDIVMAKRIDDWPIIIQQGGYLALIALYLRLEIRDQAKPIVPPKFIKWFWSYREPIVHFFFGTLLNFNSIFYYKSASLAASFGFFIFLCALITANELPALRRYGLSLRFTLWSLCLSSYLSVVFSLVSGSIGAFPFVLACGLACTILILTARSALKNHELAPQIRPRIMVPALSVILIFVMMYLFGLTPPVPLSVSYAGIYHEIEKRDGSYLLSSETASWMFWRRGDSVFVARPGDKIYFFAQIFCPTRFADEVEIHWAFQEPSNGHWISSDHIKMKITGGREEGFRGYAFKSNFQPGNWRVSVDASDGREISRLPFTVIADDSIGERTYNVVEK